jgi:hypothetical protein
MTKRENKSLEIMKRILSFDIYLNALEKKESKEKSI